MEPEQTRARRRRAVTAAAALGLLLASWIAPSAPAEVRRPQAVRRVVHVFDFEDRRSREPVPRYWFRAVHQPPERTRPGFPPWNESGYDERIAHSGKRSVKLPTKGGSVSLRLVSGAIPVVPGGDYEISAMVRTQSLEHARARLVARFTTQRHEPIEDAEVAGPLIATDGEWIETVVTLPGEFENAAWLQIDLELLQPAQQPQRRRQEFDIEQEDVDAAAWFDDINVRLTPQAKLVVGEPSHVFIGDQRPEVTATVRDPTGEPLEAQLRVFDIDGRLVDQRRFTVPPGGRQERWRSADPRFGWRRAELTVAGSRGLLGRDSVRFVRLPSRPTPAVDQAWRFGLALAPVPQKRESLTAEMIRRTDAGAVELPVHPERSAQGVAADLDRLLRALLERQRRVSIGLDGARLDEPAERSAGANPLAAMAPNKTWRMGLNELLTRYGQRIRRWRLGALETDLTELENLPAQTEAIRDELSRLVLNPQVALPWRAEIGVNESMAERASLSALLPVSFRPVGVESLAQQWPENTDLTLIIQPPEQASYGRRAAAESVIKRAAHAWRAETSRIAVVQPWTWDEGPAARPRPAAVYPAWRELIARFAGRRVVGEAPVAQGVTAMILDGQRGGAMIAWNRWAPPEKAVIDARLSDEPVTAFDPFGNRIPVDQENGNARIPLSATPIYIEGVDANLARFRAAFRIEPTFIETTAERREVKVILENPWPVAIDVRLRLNEPSQWDFRPRVLSTSIAPGETKRIPVNVALGVAEEAGPTKVRARAEVSEAPGGAAISLTSRVRLGLKGLEITPAHRYRRTEDGRDLIVTLLVRNVGETSHSLTAFAAAPGLAREQAPITNLAPGDTTVRIFVFPDVGRKVQGRTARVGVIESDGLGRLNKTFKIR